MALLPRLKTWVSEPNDFMKSKKRFVCGKCSFVYSEKKWAVKCEKWCRKYHSCNIEITNHSLGKE